LNINSSVAWCLIYLRSMLEMLKKYKPVILFLGKFFAFYIIGSFLYNQYLGLFPDRLDPVSTVITEQSTKILSLFQDDILIYYNEGYPRADVMCNGDTLYYIIEGCNALSVIILFLAFLFAFKAPLKNYLWFVPLGIVIVHISNIFRIAFLGLIILNFPKYTKMAHDVIFPGWIYGTIVILWIIWVKYLAKK